MLTIKDLAVSKELDSRAMAAVAGGHKTVITLTNVDNSGNIVVGDNNQALNNSAIVSDSFNNSFNGHGYGYGHYKKMFAL
jgi:hypothetical protein